MTIPRSKLPISLNLTVSAVKSRLHRSRRAGGDVAGRDQLARARTERRKSMNHQPFEEWLLNES